MNVAKKRLLVLWVSILLFCLNGFAAPYEMDGVPSSYEQSCIEIYNPQTAVSSTTQRDFVLSGAAKSGVTVRVYYLEKSTGIYRLLSLDEGYALQTVGASGYYAQPVTLVEGQNDFLLRVDDPAYTDKPAQLQTLSINLLVDRFWDRFRATSQSFEARLRTAFLS